MTRALKVGGQLGAVALVLALLGLLVWKVVDESSGSTKVGKAAPVIDLPDLDGTGRVKSAAFRGHAVVVNFWASWCAPCRDEAPLLEAAWRKHRDRGLIVVGIDTRDFTADAREFLREFRISYPNGYDGPGRLVEPWGLTGFPETFVIDRRGRIIEHVVGPIEDAEQLEAAVEKALA